MVINKKYIISFVVIFFMTVFSAFLSLYKDFENIKNCLLKSRLEYIFVILICIIMTFVFENLIIKKFVGTYIKNYSFLKGFVVSTIGTFFASITPAFSGASQITKTYILSKQGVPISCGASLMVIHLILTEIIMLLLGILTIFFNFDLLTNIGGISFFGIKISLVPYTLTAFFFNLFIIVIVCIMCLSYKIQKLFIFVITFFLEKLHIIKDTEKIKRMIEIQMESFRSELKKSIRDIGLTINILLLLFIKLMFRFSIPWFAGLALSGLTIGSASFNKFIASCLISNYHNLIVSMVPIPGGAGVSELFFLKLFENYYTSEYITKAAQIIWRLSSYYFSLLISFIFTIIFYNSSPIYKNEEIYNYNYTTFVTIQFEALEEKKKIFIKKMISEKSNNDREKIYDVEAIVNNTCKEKRLDTSNFLDKKNSKRIRKFTVE